MKVLISEVATYKTYPITIAPYMTIFNVKTIIYQLTGYDIWRISLMYSGVMLEDNKLVRDYKINPGDKIYLLLKRLEAR